VWGKNPFIMQEYLKLLKFVKPYTSLLILASVCMGFSTIFDGISLGMIVPLSDRVLTNKEIVLPIKSPPFLSSLIEKLNSLPPLVVLKGMAVSIILLFLLKGVLFFLQNYLMSMVGQGCVREVRNQLYKKFQDLSLDFYSRKRTGELISRITNDVGFIMHAISYALTDFIYQSMRLILFTFLVFYIYWKLALISFIIFPLILIPVLKIGKRIKKFSFEVQKKMADLNSLLAETIQGAYIVKAFCREDYEYQRFRNINYQYYRYIMKGIKRTILLSPFTEFVGALGAIVILLIAGGEVIGGRLSFGVFGLFLGSLMSMIKPIKKLSGVYSITQQALSASRRIYEILEEQPSIKERPDAVEIKDFKERIIFDNVFFKYEEKEDYVLKGINLEVAKYDRVALVGHSGVGKTTLVGLLPRLYDPQKGTIFIDGIDIKHVKIKSLRNLISIVSQEMILFNDTVKNNIAYGKQHSTSEEIEEAARKANAYDFIIKLPQKFDTIVGDRGFRLSGGQKQRLAIARAILKDAPILILDEATSQLDSESERLITETLENLMKGKTVFIIAHRLSTVQNASRIIVLDRGKIAEVGKHSELIKEGRIYKRLYELQFRV
jgi:subfamily B ATP-binding cassette protein MsbA